MSVVGKSVDKGWRIYSIQQDKYYGPIFVNEDEIDSFIEFYDGDVTLIDSPLSTDTWNSALEKWKNSSSSPDKNEQVQIQNRKKNIKKNQIEYKSNLIM